MAAATAPRVDDWPAEVDGSGVSSRLFSFSAVEGAVVVLCRCGVTADTAEGLGES